VPPRDDIARRKMLGVLAGTWLAQGCYALAELGIAEAMGDGVHGADELAAATGTDPVALLRLLRALALSGLVAQPEPGKFALTPASRLLRPDVEGSVHLNAVMQGDEIYRAFAEITHTLRTGEPAFTKVFGVPFYDYLGGNRDAARNFHESMAAQAIPAGFASCDLTGVSHVVDLGGGNGTLLAEVLANHPGIRGTLVELPDAVAVARPRLAVFADRVDFVEGSFFEVVPAGADLYVLCRVLHNWRDGAALSLLRRARAAMAPGGRLVVLEEFLPDEGAGASGAGIIDLLMLVTLEGRDRTAAEYRGLVEAAGFTVTDVRRSGSGDVTGVLEAVAGGAGRAADGTAG
jgi:SAM-dependent methyltransferase